MIFAQFMELQGCIALTSLPTKLLSMQLAMLLIGFSKLMEKNHG
jgi:hypothetical protein